MRQFRRAKERGFAVIGSLLAIAVLLVFPSGCKKPSQQVSAGPMSFGSPESAGQAVYQAAKSGDANAVLAIFGPEAKEFLLTDDPEEQKAAFDSFAADYEKMHRWGKAEGGEAVLNIGIENYPFPFPLVKTTEGQWTFSTEGARKEFLARRIGDNELTVVDVLNEMASAENEYFSTTHDGSKVKQYAQKFISSDGKQDGLYWKVAEGETESPLGPLSARASAEGYKKGTAEAPEPFHGYFYRILTQQGAHATGGARNYVVNGNMTRGFALLAYPAEYRKTGVMTFMIGPDGRVFQADLGAETVETAKNIPSFDPDETWAVVE
jgi:hypothetical protein